ncbi:MAG: T9SS type A sorting domain-containing protein [Bacteroidetes bacterium]|nr:T9SS type A sorting domain-containing protein [Bacteroidota bacterium]
MQYSKCLLCVSVLAVCVLTISALAQQSGRYVTGDFHQHTNYTDGSNSFATLAYMNNKYGLHWWANSEHGGGFTMKGDGSFRTRPPFDQRDGTYWDALSPNPIIGRVATSSGHQVMWRWQSLRDYSFQDVLTARTQYPNQLIIQGVEWNVPGHEHCSVGIIANQFGSQPNCLPIAEFEYKFDNSDTDTTGGAAQGWVKSTKTGHAKAVEAIEWLERNYPSQSWVAFAHPERRSTYKIEHFRDFSNAGPSIAMGFESMPGHQKSRERGEYSKARGTDASCTFGGTGIYAAKIGGIWDALLGEGRKWWLFASSDCHAVGTDSGMTNGPDFWPGEYQKTYTYIQGPLTAQAIVDGLRSGNSWVVSGDLIDSLDFRVNGAMMGQWVYPENGKAIITVTVRDPNTPNHNTYSTYSNPQLHHVDVIVGNVSGIIPPTSPNYTNATNPSARVVARFDNTGGIRDSNGIVSQRWTALGNGVYTFSLTLPVTSPMYVRLRGTNHPLNTPNETDVNGNPLADTLIANTAAAAFADLWFYSNPIFVYGSANEVEASTLQPGSFTLEQNYPNPFNPTTRIRYSITGETHVTLKVYDILGREVAVLKNERQGGGSYAVEFDAASYKLSSGVYIYKLQTDFGSETRAMVLTK